MTTNQVETQLEALGRSSHRAAVLSFLGCLMVFMAIGYSIYQLQVVKKQRAVLQRTQEASAGALKRIAADKLARILSLDRSAEELTDGANPYVYLWQRESNAIPPDVLDQLIQVLLLRRSAIAEAGPMLEYSEGLRSYACQHIWFVIMESLPAATASTTRKALIQHDERFRITELAGKPNDSSIAIIVGVFLTLQDAKKLALKTSVAQTNSEKLSAVRSWSFGQYQAVCSSGATR